MNYVLISIGNVPEYIKYTINTIFSVDRDAFVYLGTDQNIDYKNVKTINLNNIESEQTKYLKELNIYKKTIFENNPLWLSSLLRIFYLRDFQKELGLKNLVHFDNDVFIDSINLAKWNIYIVSLQDLTFFTFSYIHNNFNLNDFEKSKRIYETIIDEEIKNGMPQDIAAHGKKTFFERYEKIDWKKYYNSLPFNPSALALYKWAPIAEELKTLDRKIVLNSMILKWDNIKDEFIKLIKF